MSFKIIKNILIFTCLALICGVIIYKFLPINSKPIEYTVNLNPSLDSNSSLDQPDQEVKNQEIL